MNTMTRIASTMILGTALLVSAAISTSAHADDDDRYRYGVSSGKILSHQQIIKSLERKGYRNIHDIDLDDGIYEVEARNAQNREVDIKVDPSNGKILYVEIDD